MDDDQYLGEIRMFAGSAAPTGWALCNGTSLNIAAYPELFNLIGTTFGGTDTTFNLPDLQGRAPLGLMIGTYWVGTSGGVEQVQLTIDQLPAHSHSVQAASAGGSDDPSGRSWGQANKTVYGPPGRMSSMNSAGISSAGLGNAHDNMIPFVTVSYIIALEGMYPPF